MIVNVTFLVAFFPLIFFLTLQFQFVHGWNRSRRRCCTPTSIYTCIHSVQKSKIQSISVKKKKKKKKTRNQLAPKPQQVDGTTSHRITSHRSDSDDKPQNHSTRQISATRAPHPTPKTGKDPIHKRPVMLASSF